MDALKSLELQSGEKLLIYGIGNVGRQDDGLGIRLVEKLGTVELPPFVSLEANYQLNIEDALLISSYDVVLFVDASLEKGGETPFSIRPVQPSSDVAFSTHAISIEGIRYLCEALYLRRPRTFLLALPGYDWEISEKLSDLGKDHLDETFRLLVTELGVS